MKACNFIKKGDSDTGVFLFILRNFQEHLWTTASGFSQRLYYNEAMPTVFRKSQMNTLYVTPLTIEVPFRYIIFFSAA